MSERDINKMQCCSVKTMCGVHLWRGVVSVSIATMILATIMLIVAICNVMLIMQEPQVQAKPSLAVDLLFGLIIIGISSYQDIISALLLWQALKTKGKIFLCSLWYSSHLSILVVYSIMFCARVVVCFQEGRYVGAAFTICGWIVYDGITIYFVVVVNSHLNALDREMSRYF